MLLPTRLHQYYHSLAELPSCVTPSLTYYKLGSQTSKSKLPEGTQDHQRG